MDNDVKISLGVAALGATGFFYGRNTNNGSLAKNSTLIGVGGLGYAAIKSIYKNRQNPKTWAITAIPLGAAMIVVAGAGAALGGVADEKAKIKIQSVASVGAALALGGGTFLLTKNIRTSAILGLIGVAAILYYSNYEKTKNNSNVKGNESQNNTQPIQATR